MDIKLIRPLTLNELWDTLYSHTDARLYAGGTDVLVKARQGVLYNTLVCLDGMSGLMGIHEHQGEIYMGACTTLAEIASNPTIRRWLPLLASSVATIGSPLIRNTATIVIAVRWLAIYSSGSCSEK